MQLLRLARSSAAAATRSLRAPAAPLPPTRRLVALRSQGSEHDVKHHMEQVVLAVSARQEEQQLGGLHAREDASVRHSLPHALLQNRLRRSR